MSTKIARHVDVVVVRDPDGPSDICVFVDGVPVDECAGFVCSVVDIDPGRGWTRAEWIDAMNTNLARVHSGIVGAVQRMYIDAGASEYVEG